MILGWLIKGFAVTAKKVFLPKVTQHYPDVYPDLVPRTRSDFYFEPEKCTSCNMCVIACPNKVINVAVFKDSDGKRQLEEYQMSLSYCLYCGMCTEACPTAAIQMCARFEPAYYKKENSLKRWRGPKAS